MGDYDITEEEIVGGIVPKATKKEQAKDLLLELSEEQNKLETNEIMEIAKERGISKRTMQEVKLDLSLKSVKIGSTWYWKLNSKYFK
jgi:hypothetical protein